MMTHVLKSALLAATLLASAGAAYAQAAPRAYGHWEGMLSSPLGSTALYIDIGADADGNAVAAISLPDENIAGLPLGNVKIEGDTLGFSMPIAGEGSFRGALGADGKTFTGSLDKGFGSAEFSLSRAGEARFPAPLKNAPVDARYEGAWSGGLGEGGPALHVRLANKNGGAVGTVTVDEGVGIPLRINEQDGLLTLDIASAGELIEVGLDADGNLAGDFVSDSGRQKLTLRRAK
jgi:hypothetical protein